MEGDTTRRPCDEREGAIRRRQPDDHIGAGRPVGCKRWPQARMGAIGKTMSGEDALVKEQASGLGRLARESDDDAHSAPAGLAEEYDALSANPKPWLPLAGAPQAVAGEEGA